MSQEKKKQKKNLAGNKTFEKVAFCFFVFFFLTIAVAWGGLEDDLARARELRASGELAASREIYERIISVSPNSPGAAEALASLGLLLLDPFAAANPAPTASRDPEVRARALGLLEHAVILQDSLFTLSSLADGLFLLGKADEAVRVYTRALARTSQAGDRAAGRERRRLEMNRGLARHAAGDHERAVVELSAYAESMGNRTEPRVWTLLADAATKARGDAGCVAVLSDLLRATAPHSRHEPIQALAECAARTRRHARLAAAATAKVVGMLFSPERVPAAPTAALENSAAARVLALRGAGLLAEADRALRELMLEPAARRGEPPCPPEIGAMAYLPLALGSFACAQAARAAASLRSISEELRQVEQYRQGHDKQVREFVPQGAGRTVRIGVIVDTLSQGAAESSIVPLLEHARSRGLEAVCFHAEPAPVPAEGDDGGRGADAGLARYRAACSKLVSLVGRGPAEAAEIVRGERVDIALQTTVLGAAMLALRPAPVTAFGIGYPDPLAPRADVFIGDPRSVNAFASRSLGPDGPKLVSLPLHFLPSSLPSLGKVVHAEPNPVTAASLGLPDGALVFGSFSDLLKLDHVFAQAVAAVLRQVPGSVFLMVVPVEELDEYQVGNLRDTFAALGVDPARVLPRSRLPYGTHLQAARHIDVALDSFGASGAVTAIDLLFAGVPLVTWPISARPGARTAAGALEAVSFDCFCLAVIHSCFCLHF